MLGWHLGATTTSVEAPVTGKDIAWVLTVRRHDSAPRP
jgi:hypothetical protein